MGTFSGHDAPIVFCEVGFLPFHVCKKKSVKVVIISCLFVSCFFVFIVRVFVYYVLFLNCVFIVAVMYNLHVVICCMESGNYISPLFSKI